MPCVGEIPYSWYFNDKLKVTETVKSGCLSCCKGTIYDQYKTILLNVLFVYRMMRCHWSVFMIFVIIYWPH